MMENEKTTIASNQPYLIPTYFIDSDSEIVSDFASDAIGETKDPIEKAVALFFAVRDKIRYDPYRISLEKKDMAASSTIQRSHGFCVTKAIALAAVARSVGIPARPGFANVKNHLNSPRLQTLMKTDIFIYHGYTEFYLLGKWVKATPAFNIELCERAGLFPLDFDGKSDSLFHAYNRKGDKYMEYLVDHGSFQDLPYETLMKEYALHYPHWLTMEKLQSGRITDNIRFEEEVEKKYE